MPEKDLSEHVTPCDKQLKYLVFPFCLWVWGNIFISGTCDFQLSPSEGGESHEEQTERWSPLTLPALNFVQVYSLHETGLWAWEVNKPLQLWETK
jgi:hypothetical protein